MPAEHFVKLKQTIRTMHADFGSPISSRESHRIAQGVMLSQFAEKFTVAAESYFKETSDTTGETATDNVLVQYLRKYGKLAAPRYHNENESIAACGPTCCSSRFRHREEAVLAGRHASNS